MIWGNEMAARLRLFGLAMGAILAIGVVIASMASADQLESETGPVRLTAAQEHFFLPPEQGGFTIATDTFLIGGGLLECSSTTYSGTKASAEPTSTFTMTPSYGACKYGVATSLESNGCSYLFHINNSGLPPTGGTVDIVCPAGKEMTFTSIPAQPRCVFHIPPQTGLNGVTYSNIGSGSTREITVRVETPVNSLKYSQTPGVIFKCPAAMKTDGRWWAAFVITGEEDKEGAAAHIGIFLK